MFGLYIRANRADALREERHLLIAEHRKPENRRPRKVGFDEIMQDLATGRSGRFLDRKVQAYISRDNWPPTTSTETFDVVEDKGLDNAWTSSVQGVERLIMLSHPDVYRSINLSFDPYCATFDIDSQRYAVTGKSAAMALMGVHLTVGRLRQMAKEAPLELSSFVTLL